MLDIFIWKLCELLALHLHPHQFFPHSRIGMCSKVWSCDDPKVRPPFSKRSIIFWSKYYICVRLRVKIKDWLLHEYFSIQFVTRELTFISHVIAILFEGKVCFVSEPIMFVLRLRWCITVGWLLNWNIIVQFCKNARKWFSSRR